jgi:hypothetical protein
MADDGRWRFLAAPQVIVGGLIVAWGLALTAGNIGWLDSWQIEHVYRLWPLAIVVFGAAKFKSSSVRSSQVIGALGVIVGLWMTAGEFYGWRIHVWQWWPLLLVIGGVLMITRVWEHRDLTGTTASDGVEFAFWSGVERRISTPDFRHSDITAVMGGIDLDFRGASTATGEAVLDVFAMMGGIEITVPPDWVVVNRIMPIMGGIEDRSTGSRDAKHRLILRGTVIMGGVEVHT